MMVMQLPIGVWLPTAPRVALSADAIYPATFKHCVTTVCLVEVKIAVAMIAMLSDESHQQGQLLLAIQEGQATLVPILPRGFRAAFYAVGSKRARSLLLLKSSVDGVHLQRRFVGNLGRHFRIAGDPGALISESKRGRTSAFRRYEYRLNDRRGARSGHWVSADSSIPT
jgi:hypothetical protein